MWLILFCFLFFGGEGEGGVACDSNSWLLVTVLISWYICLLFFFQFPLPLVTVGIIMETKHCYIVPWFWACGRSSKSEFICIFHWLEHKGIHLLQLHWVFGLYNYYFNNSKVLRECCLLCFFNWKLNI